MADDKRTAPRASGGARRRRPAPTIDLTAAEVDAGTATEQQGTSSPGAPPFSSEINDAPASTGRGRHPVWRYAAAGLLGGIVAVLVLAGFWAANPTTRSNSDVSQLQAQLAALQAQMRDVSQARTLPQAPDAASAERLAAVESAVKAAGIALAALTKRSDDIAAAAAAARERADAAAKSAAGLQDALGKLPASASREDVEGLRGQIVALESAAKATQEKVTKSGEADAAARMALAALALRDAVARGESYAAELAAAKSLGADDKTLAQLAPFAASGVPNNAVLARELSALLPAMAKAANADPSKSGGFIEKLQANAEKLVRIRPIDAPQGSDPAAVLARIEVSASRNDVAVARAELSKLPANVRALTADWEARADARAAALAASRALVADAARALTSR